MPVYAYNCRQAFYKPAIPVSLAARVFEFSGTY
jgi:hypothetical protein